MTEPTKQDERSSERSPDDYATRVSPFVERFAADLAEVGFQRMAARVFSCVLASEDGALGSAELAERLQVSPAAVSGAVRYLSQMRMVSREREPGSRRELYRVHGDTWYEAFTRENEYLARWTETLRAGAQTLGPDTAVGRRLEDTGEFFEFLREEMSQVMERWRARRAAENPPPGNDAPDTP
ncbi:GbsR/MarR family transcriptional regulator [Streptomyces sp. TR06-5]|uniref:GbsR/MarR family transcriptional regulator n=1 Tax=unclassified Streptomyces TaxID=2593676 RepID=UPI0039A1DA0E